MGIATSLATFANNIGITVDDVLKEAGVDREGAIRNLAATLGVDLTKLAGGPDLSKGVPVEITEADVNKVREGLAVLNRTFS